MIALLKHYFNIAFLMGKPQDLPAGEQQLYTAIILNFITYILALSSFTTIGGAALHAAIDIGCTGICLYLALMAVDRLPRFQQAYGAICGAGAVLNLAAIPMLLMSVTPDGETPSSLAMFSRFLLLVWSLSLIGHVLRHTFSLKMFTSIIFALLYYMLISNVLAAVFPPESRSGALEGEISMIQPLASDCLQIG